MNEDIIVTQFSSVLCNEQKIVLIRIIIIIYTKSDPQTPKYSCVICSCFIWRSFTGLHAKWNCNGEIFQLLENFQDKRHSSVMPNPKLAICNDLLFCIWLCCEYVQCVSVFGCFASIYSVFLYLIVLWVFIACFCIWLFWIFAVHFYIGLCWVYFQCSLFCCIVSISSMCFAKLIKMLP